MNLNVCEHTFTVNYWIFVRENVCGIVNWNIGITFRYL